MITREQTNAARLLLAVRRHCVHQVQQIVPVPIPAPADREVVKSGHDPGQLVRPAAVLRPAVELVHWHWQRVRLDAVLAVEELVDVVRRPAAGEKATASNAALEPGECARRKRGGGVALTEQSARGGPCGPGEARSPGGVPVVLHVEQVQLERLLGSLYR